MEFVVYNCLFAHFFINYFMRGFARKYIFRYSFQRSDPILERFFVNRIPIILFVATQSQVDFQLKLNPKCMYIFQPITGGD